MDYRSHLSPLLFVVATVNVQKEFHRFLVIMGVIPISWVGARQAILHVRRVFVPDGMHVFHRIPTSSPEFTVGNVVLSTH
ncbi:hypothetical protein D3C73_730470 [compost metagenome]